MKNQKTITRNYDGRELKPAEVLVPIMYDEGYAKAYCKNPECIKTLRKGGQKFKVMYIAVPEECAAAARSSFNLSMNEELGHYAVPNSISRDQMTDEFDLEFGTSPSPEDLMIEREEQAETADLIADTMHQLIEHSPKHGLAALLLISGIKGADFSDRMHLGHDAANTVRRQAQEMMDQGLANIDLDELHAKRSKHTEYYIEEANRLLDSLLKALNK